MAATSYTTLPSNTYAGLGSQGDLFHAANYGTYDTGVGSLISPSNQYLTTNYDTHLTDNQRRQPYSNDYLQSNYSNNDYSTQQPQYYSNDRYAQQSTYNQDTLLNDYSNSQKQTYNDRSTIPNNIDENYPTNDTIPSTHKTTIDDHHVESNNRYQPSHPGTTQYQPPASSDNQRHQSQISSQSNLVQSDPQIISQNSSKKLPQTTNHRSPSNGTDGNPPSEMTTKINNPKTEMKTTKSTQMRAAAIKKKEENRDQKQKNSNISLSKKKATPPTSTKPQQHLVNDVEQNDKEKSKRNKKQSHSVPKQRTNHHETYQTDDNNTSGDENNNTRQSRSKSKKHTALSDSHQGKHPSLPPIRRGRGPPFYDPVYDHPHPNGYPLRGRHPYYDDYLPYGPYPHPGRYDYRYRHLYEDGFDTPPYLPASHYPYDGFFDYEKRKPKSKSKTYKDKKEMNTDHDDREGITDYETEHEDDIKNEKTKKIKNKKTKSKDDDNKNEKPKQQKQQQPQQQQQQQRSSPNYPDPSYDDEHDMLELWRQERNDYLKKKYKPTVHDILYSQQWMKTDSYLENQRRRALRDIQGYYFPYKKYTLKDYKDLQKHDAQNNPYASINEPTPDRKERARKRQEYSSHIERQTGDISGRQNKSPQDTQSRKPWHSSHSEPNDPEKVSKRERALEYAKVQVVKTRSQRAANDKSSSLDPTEKYVNGLFPHNNDDDDDEGSVLCKINKNKHLHECFTVLKCGEISTNLSIVFQGFPGLHGSQGVTGLPGPIGPQGLTGPPGKNKICCLTDKNYLS
ncbi:unnamed protein product [Rotaria sordida]|uniref:Uncharacterized protein n=1 Tax=Rotaria sordida TaxID=392033 RepID=A0A819SJJ9_9BILA|nr:unnamed protein product [Rotaria sordida]